MIKYGKAGFKPVKDKKKTEVKKTAPEGKQTKVRNTKEDTANG